MSKSKLNSKIIKKYNELYEEVAGYYNISKFIRKSSRREHYGINYIILTEIGLISGYTKKDARKFLYEKYPHLVPFYDLYHSVYDNYTFDAELSKRILKEINKTIKKLRKEKHKILKEYDTAQKTSTNPCCEIPLGQIYQFKHNEEKI